MSIESEIPRLNLDKVLRNIANVKAQKYVYLSKCDFRIVDCNSGSGTQISGSASSSSSRHLTFFWLQI